MYERLEKPWELTIRKIANGYIVEVYEQLDGIEQEAYVYRRTEDFCSTIEAAINNMTEHFAEYKVKVDLP